MSEHAMIVKFDYGTTDLGPLFELEDQLETLLEDGKYGEYDGHEIAVDGSDGLLYLYGPDADERRDLLAPDRNDPDLHDAPGERRRLGRPDALEGGGRDPLVRRGRAGGRGGRLLLQGNRGAGGLFGLPVFRVAPPCAPSPRGRDPR